MALKMWEHKSQGILEFWFLSFLATDIPDALPDFPFEGLSSSYCLYKEIFAKPGLIVLMNLRL